MVTPSQSLQCRFCGSDLSRSFCDLGMSPLSNAFVKETSLASMERFYPLHAYVCESCLLVQLKAFSSPEEIFDDYAYFSSYSESWLRHCKKYTEYMTERFNLDETHQVIEIASNDGYLLKYFKDVNIPVLGIEPAENVALVAQQQGVKTVVKFFGTETANELAAADTRADLLLGNNVLAHVPDLNDFVSGLKILLKPTGVITMEFPHLLKLIEENQFDTIYHEHFSYFSFHTVKKIFAHHGLILFDVEELPTHGGSIRIFAQHDETGIRSVDPHVEEMLKKEDTFGINDLNTYDNFFEQVRQTKNALLEFLINAKREKKSVVGYGAAAKGNTLLNYCCIRTDYLDYTVDLSPHKQGMYLPGTHIPIYSPDKVKETRPDYILILPWNIKDEIIEQMSYVCEWNAKFVIPIPQVKVIE